MTDNESFDVISGLNCCKNNEEYDIDKFCGDCEFASYGKDCKIMLLDKSIDLINRQKAKIEALQMDNKQLETDNFNANMNLEHMTAEIERLQGRDETAEKIIRGQADKILNLQSENDRLTGSKNAERIKREEEQILTAIHNVGIHVDRHELEKALRYDREQYKKGYADGVKEFSERLLRSAGYEVLGYNTSNPKGRFIIDADYFSYLEKEMGGDTE